MSSHHEEPWKTPEGFVALPAPTAWPLALAFGILLIFLGVVTSAAISVLGAVLAVAGGLGWFREVLPEERHEFISLEAHEAAPTFTYRAVTRIHIDERHRARLPVTTPSVTAGLKGGVAGGLAMIVPATLYGLIAYHSLWYAVNLLGGAGVADWTNPTLAQITHFRLSALVTAAVIHTALSLLVGLLYGATLPVLPRHPILLGGLIAPLLWTGLMHSSLSLVNPYLDQKIHWGWFVISQVAFGLVAGWVVARQAHIRTEQYLPFAARVGLEAPGLMAERTEPGDEGR